MVVNVGLADAWLRGAAAVVAIVVAAVVNHLPILSLGFAVLGLLLMGTALTRFCPLYNALGLSTAGPHDAGRHHP